ncbi:MAG: hypothetical protein HY908_24825, partial [Myxococcales bacterium]|nr:hypothetical protein [Myxococcales bacterium]
MLRKLHSLSGVLPVGAFLVFHLWTNARALQGERAYGEMVDGLQRTPYLLVFEILLLASLGFHALYGVVLGLGARHNVRAYPHSRNWMYTLQRVTGLFALAFIGYHLYTQWVGVTAGRVAPSELYASLCRDLSTTRGGVPLAALAYVLGIAACAFHFANGLWSFAVSWGIVISRRAQRRAAMLFGLVGIAVFVLGANTVLYFATGSRFLLPSSRADRDDTVACAAPPEPSDDAPTGTAAASASGAAEPSATAPTASAAAEGATSSTPAPEGSASAVPAPSSSAT